MRTLISLVASAVLVIGTGVAIADPVGVPLVPVPAPGVASANVTQVGNVPLDGSAVSMRVVKVGKQVRAFVSGTAGLSIYDATNPAAPLLLGHLPIYNWENEDLAVSDDGKTAILTEFDGLLYLHVVDVSNPNLPTITGTLKLRASHTVQCADRACNYLYGSEGQTYDLRDRANPKQLPAEQSWGAQTGARGGGHALHRDAAGIWIADTMPLVVFKQTPDPLHLTVLTRGTITGNTGYQHNNIRPRADKYRPRGANASFDGPLRPGELLLGEGETGVTQLDAGCNNSSGAFSTWSMVGFDQGYPMEQLDVLRPFSGDYLNGNPRVSGLACSGHWFEQKDAKDGSILVTAAWYEHGTRFLKVDPKTGKIRQVGFFQPVRGSASSSYWMPGAGGDYVWTMDYHSGIDILKFDQTKPAASAAQLDASWAAKLGVVDSWSSIMRIVCRENGKATPAQRSKLDRARARQPPRLDRSRQPDYPSVASGRRSTTS